MTTAEVTSYTELIKAIDAERVAIGIRHLDFEVLTGMTQGHWGKAAGMLQVKKLGIEKIFDALRAAGLRIRLEIDPDQRAKMLARIADNFNPSNQNQARKNNHSSPVGMALTSRVFKQYARKGGKASWTKKSKKERFNHQRMASNARWRAYRKAKQDKEKQRIRARVRRRRQASLETHLNG